MIWIIILDIVFMLIIIRSLWIVRSIQKEADKVIKINTVETYDTFLSIEESFSKLLFTFWIWDIKKFYKDSPK